MPIQDAKAPRPPRAPHQPGLYRFKLDGPSGQAGCIGEADNPERRFQHDRTSAPSQPTDQRLNKLMLEKLADQGKVSVAILTENARLRSPDRERGIDFSSTAERTRVELLDFC